METGGRMSKPSTYVRAGYMLRIKRECGVP